MKLVVVTIGMWRYGRDLGAREALDAEDRHVRAQTTTVTP